MATVYLDIPRKSLGQLQVIKSTDAGETWATVTGTLDSVKNKLAVDAADTDIVILSSTAFAKQTKESVNSPVLHGEAGLGSVFVFSDYRIDRGELLQESLTGKIGTSNLSSSSNQYSNLSLLVKGVDHSLNVLHSHSLYTPQHVGLITGAPLNNSPAVKSLSYQVANNNQASMNFAFNELVWDGDWGDDSTIKIADGVTTGTDLNGNTRLIGTHTLALPYGWVRNKI